MIMRCLSGLTAAAVALAVCGPARAGGPAAIVEDVAGQGVAVQFMDYVQPGRVIRLGAEGRLVLGYLRSCLRETIAGGTVTVGEHRSRVDGGRVTRERVECDGGSLNLTAEQAGKSAVAVFRKPASAGGDVSSAASFRIFSTNPFIRLTASGPSVTIERLDRDAQPLTVALTDGSADLAALRQSLPPGGVYRARGGGREVVFRIDAFAQPGGPILSRLVAF